MKIAIVAAEMTRLAKAGGLGDVMKESAQTAMSYTADIHIHVPASAISKSMSGRHVG